MSLGVNIELNGFDELHALWQQAPEITVDELETTTWLASELLEGEIKELTPVGASGGGGGGLRDSISAEDPVVLANQVIGVVGTSSPYAVPVELGTKPHFPPLEPLKDWVRARLTNVAESEVDGVALAIARKIAARGTLAVGMFHRGFAYSERQISGMYEDAMIRIVNRMAGQG